MAERVPEHDHDHAKEVVPRKKPEEGGRHVAIHAAGLVADDVRRVERDLNYCEHAHRRHRVLSPGGHERQAHCDKDRAEDAQRVHVGADPRDDVEQGVFVAVAKQDAGHEHERSAHCRTKDEAARHQAHFGVEVAGDDQA
eukprot:scaffold2771_cov252-Pinguiococcus_pyrenoidosus.AAC.33